MIPELRAAHLEEIDAVSPCERCVGFGGHAGAVRAIVGPVPAGLAAAGGGLEGVAIGRPRSARAGFFAIENLDPAEALAGADTRLSVPARAACACSAGARGDSHPAVFGMRGVEVVYLIGSNGIVIRDLPTAPPGWAWSSIRVRSCSSECSSSARACSSC